MLVILLRMEDKVMKIAIYTIALNEEKHVKDWFESGKDADLLLIADTGSTDNTVAEAKKLGIEVQEISVNPWRFDTARNASLALLPKDIDMCIQLDMDETLSPGWRKEVEKAFAEDNFWPTYKQVTSWSPDGEPINFFYYFKIHHRHNFAWKHPIHEVIEPKDGAFYPRKEIDVRTYHKQDVTKDRTSYLKLLQMAVSESPNDWRMNHYLCREYSYKADFQNVIHSAYKALDIGYGWDQERASTCIWASQAAQGLGYLHWAYEWAKKGTQEAPEFYEAWHWRAQIAHLMGKWSDCYYSATKIDSLERQISHLNNLDAWNWWGFDLAALSAHKLGFHQEAVDFGLRAIKGNPSLERLNSNQTFYEKSLKESLNP